MDWAEHFSLWLKVRDQHGSHAYLRLQEARKSVQKNTSTDWQWLSDSLASAERKLFVALVFERQPVPKRLLAAFLHAAVMERDPSANRWYIAPCVRSWGSREIYLRLLHYLQNGSNEEKAGAASALYWAGENPRNEDLTEVRNQVRSLLLREFVSNTDVAVRQRIIPMLKLDPSAYEFADRPLIAEAIALARAHPDEYIRHRIEIQLGDRGPLKPIPRISPHAANALPS